MKLDEVDARIIELLQKDGRMMYKDLARFTRVSLPTVRYRIKRLTDMGVIRKFTVVTDPGKISGKTRAILAIDGRSGDLDTIAGKLAEMEETREVFVTAGSSGIVAKVEVDDISRLEELITRRITQIPEIQSSKSSILVKTVKEEFGVRVKPQVGIRLKCPFCNSPIAGEPYVEEIRGVPHYFSGKACAEAYRERYVEKTAKHPLEDILRTSGK